MANPTRKYWQHCHEQRSRQWARQLGRVWGVSSIAAARTPSELTPQTLLCCAGSADVKQTGRHNLQSLSLEVAADDQARRRGLLEAHFLAMQETRTLWQVLVDVKPPASCHQRWNWRGSGIDHKGLPSEDDADGPTLQRVHCFLLRTIYPQHDRKGALRTPAHDPNLVPRLRNLVRHPPDAVTQDGGSTTVQIREADLPHECVKGPNCQRDHPAASEVRPDAIGTHCHGSRRRKLEEMDGPTL
eukprot:CAMPEP_0204129310 /NCGR_PEP_ID=MMETSP0361-20130328/12697_1 /ASSEMBLY_ACC=CAM_ASM_000343 /TAXON_ID=268821 /ORGANISM="Scrippsiella Hangoei, Strain SHTV-5" /LENGTH=242 /DNA_ID=CAMNT_0051081695 /DNA_START=10 /DNA_END=735 /DNA_ORIENTATION=-